jgi:hypothetical protein
VPVAWSADVIRATVNLGGFTPGQAAYLYVVDETGAPNASGYPVVVAGPAGGIGSPANLRVTSP